VTEENKHEYVQLVAEQQMTRGIKEQVRVRDDGWGLRGEGVRSPT
jgi:hypothetical protein